MIGSFVITISMTPMNTAETKRGMTRLEKMMKTSLRPISDDRNRYRFSRSFGSLIKIAMKQNEKS